MDILKLQEQLIMHEDEKLFPYRDTKNKITIGIGHNLSDNGISHKISRLIFSDDINSVLNDLSNNLPWFKNLDDIRQRVLADMCFNMGIHTLLEFVNTLHFIEIGNYPAAADNMLKSLWGREVGPRAIRLAEMMKSGEDYK